MVQQLGASGVTQDPEFATKREARAKRFQLCNLPEPSYTDVQQMYESLDVSKEQRDLDPKESDYRFETIHITGKNFNICVLLNEMYVSYLIISTAILFPKFSEFQ